jgi:hypothetical protein
MTGRQGDRIGQSGSSALGAPCRLIALFFVLCSLSLISKRYNQTPIKSNSPSILAKSTGRWWKEGEGGCAGIIARPTLRA